jgi:hypothetical protein
MKRNLVAATAAFLALAVPTAATAAAKKPTKPKKPVKHVRTVSFAYGNPCGATLQSSQVYGPGGSYCPPDYVVDTKPTEHYISVTVADKSGQAVPVTFIEDGTTDSWQIVCGKVTNSSVLPNDTYDFNPMVSLGDSCPVPATQGTVTIKLSNLP